MTDIIPDNALSPDAHQVYVDAAATAQEFAYSDGESTERYLAEVFDSESDLSVASPALQARIIDWPTEYHLSSARANLLRPYDLKGVTRVLELGSGCGAITRYLGEQGFEVDAIEGSAIRARLGRARCRGLDNVRIINANYNDLSIPKGHYDLVLFVGVIEYASKFHPDAPSDREAARRILSAAGRFLAPGGAVLVAIENRLGLKYQLGVHEDHYGKRYVGVDGYRDSAGIATYSMPEWRALATESGFGAMAFSYPFPDYKLPKAVLSEHYVSQDSHASNHLEGMISRDYYAPVARSITETIGWQAAAQGGYIGDVANSFSVLLGDSETRLGEIQGFDFFHGPGAGRRAAFAAMTYKPQNGTEVIKTRMVDSSEPLFTGTVDGVSQDLATQPYYQGQLLSAQWLRDIVIHVRRDEIDRHLTAYYAFLKHAAGQNTLAIDLLPINIVVDAEGQWQVFDQEWRVDWPLSPEFVLFRSLLTFIVSNWANMREFLRWLELQTVRDFIEYGFHANQIHLSEYLDDFIEQETRFQRAIAADPDTVDLPALLETVFTFEGSGSDQVAKIYTTVWWRGTEESFDPARSATIESDPEPASTAKTFPVPEDASIAAIRIDPFDLRKPDDVGFFRVEGLRIIRGNGSDAQELFSVTDPQQLAGMATASSAVFEPGGNAGSGHGGWIATTDFPSLELALKLDAPVVVEAKNDCYIEVLLGVTRTEEYILAYNQYLVRSLEAGKQARRGHQNLIAMKAVVENLEFTVEKLEGDIETAKRDSESHRREVEQIKSSRAFRLGTRIAGVASTLKRLAGRSRVPE